MSVTAIESLLPVTLGDFGKPFELSTQQKINAANISAFWSKIRYNVWNVLQINSIIPVKLKLTPSFQRLVFQTPLNLLPNFCKSLSYHPTIAWILLVCKHSHWKEKSIRLPKSDIPLSTLQTQYPSLLVTMQLQLQRKRAVFSQTRWTFIWKRINSRKQTNKQPILAFHILEKP